MGSYENCWYHTDCPSNICGDGVGDSDKSCAATNGTMAHTAVALVESFSEEVVIRI